MDQNHELLYKYCSQKYVLMLADDDVLLSSGIKMIEEYVREHSFLFAVCNSVDTINDGLQTDYCYKDCHELMQPLEAIDYFIYDKPMKVFPMLPYIGGIIVNLDLMREMSTSEERNTFCGTYHQYIGGLWKILLHNQNDQRIKGGLITKPVVAIGCDSDKTWYPYLQSVMEKMDFYYDNLGLDPVRRKHISTIIRCSGRFTHYLYKPVRAMLKKWVRKSKRNI